MPMSRYEIRNEYSLADLQLYTAADKDDPEALLEGIAMAGLVGLLRQLGDLAEFAAEIFHELHDEVMSVSSRGHNLKSRVQNLEMVVPSIEKSFLSQTDHSSSLYNTGVDWHPNLRMDHNLVTQRDLPRFVMDSYEECRGPPHLFLLDKFDVAGDGACLKRYTDPSFSKVETSLTKTNGTDGQREKKIRKAKKKGPRLRNGGTPESLPQSHSKLHQLFMEERVGNGEEKLSGGVKLKRKLSGFPFDLKTGQSYMDKFLKDSSPEPKVLHEVIENLAASMIFPENDLNDFNLSVHQVRSMSPDRDSDVRKINPSLPKKDIISKPYVDELEMVSAGEILEEDNSYPNISKDVPNSFDQLSGEEDIAIDEKRITEDNLIRYLSDDIASEIDNYVDAPMTMESEIDTDSEVRVKNDFTFAVRSQPTATDANSTEQQLHFNPSTSQSTTDGRLSDNDNYSSVKMMSSLVSSNCPSSSSDCKISGNDVPSEDLISGSMLEIEDNCSSPYVKTVSEDVPLAHLPRSVFSDNPLDVSTTITAHTADVPIVDCDSEVVLMSRGLESIMKSPIMNQLEKVTRSPGFSDSGSQSGDSTIDMSPEFLQEDIEGHDPDKRSSNETEEQKESLLTDPVCSFSVSDSESVLGDNSTGSSPRGNPVPESNSMNPCISGVSDIMCYSKATDISPEFLYQDSSSQKNLNLGENLFSLLNKCTIIPPNKNDTIQIISTENVVKDDVNDENLKFPEKNYTMDIAFAAHDGDSFMSAVCEKEKPICAPNNEVKDVFPAASNGFPSCMVALPEGELENTSPGKIQIIDAKVQDSDNSLFSEITSQELTLHLECSREWSKTSIDVNGRDDAVKSDEGTPINKSFVVDSEKPCEVRGLQVTGITDNVASHASSHFESSRCTLENFELLAETTESVKEEDETRLMSSNGQEANKTSICPILTPRIDINAHRNDPESKENLSEEVVVASAVPALADSSDLDGVCSALCDGKLGEEGKSFFEYSSPDELQKGRNTLSVSSTESCSLEEVVVASAVPALTDSSDQDAVCSALCDGKLGEEGKSFFEYSSPEELQKGKNTLSVSSTESCSLEEVGESVAVPLDLDSVLSNNITHNLLRPELSEIVPHSNSDLVHQHRFDSIDVQLSLEQSSLSKEQESFQKRDLINCFLSSEAAVIRILQEQSHLQTNQLNIECLDSGETGQKLSSPPSMCVQPMHGIDDKLVTCNSSSKCSLLNCPSPPLPSELPSVNNYEVDFSGDSNSIFGCKFYQSGDNLMFSANNLMPDANFVNPEELPPLPPLPPAQWRMGKVQPAASITETVTTQNEELPSQGISIPFKSAVQVNPSCVESNQSPIQITQHIAAGEENVENSSSMEATVVKHEIIDLPVKTENKQEEVIISASEIGLPLPEPEAPIIASRKERVENSFTSSEISSENPMTISHRHKTENEKQELTNPSSEIRFLSCTVEDGNEDSSQTKKPPGSQTPLIETVAALNKSKLRKVTDRVRPEIPKVDEKDSFLEQIRTKSFNLKPALATRPSIQGPRTNLKVTAILAKANAIRQALADSDEDEDGWSDS